MLLMLLSNLSGLKAEDKIQLPPMPDEKENSKTLLGIDVNKNGVRDDIEIYIYKNISQDKDVFNAYMQMARTDQLILAKYPNKKEVQRLRIKNNKNIYCIKVIDEQSEINAQKLSVMTRLAFNTKERRKVDKWIAENSYEMPAPMILRNKAELKREEVCDF